MWNMYVYQDIIQHNQKLHLFSDQMDPTTNTPRSAQPINISVQFNDTTNGVIPTPTVLSSEKKKINSFQNLRTDKNTSVEG